MSEVASAITSLLELMARLRDPRCGCPWDQKQTFATIAPYTIEEAYEVADAIERGEPERLRDELGDLLFQVVFHAQLARERGWFDFGQVASAIHDKLVRRHPHVFGGANVSDESQLSRDWEDQKARERAAAAGAEAVSALADVPRGLPALVRAAKLGRRARRVGFDWPDARGVRDKVLEELREVDTAVATAVDSNSREVVEEVGDLLFALANWSRHLQIDAEEALRAANSKFERRFRAMESFARGRGADLDKLTAAQWEELWEEAKQQELQCKRSADAPAGGATFASHGPARNPLDQE
jgi:nucleoside triphosphate diphosphatase